MAGKSTPTFESSLKELEAIVAALESEALPLEKALEKFEAGIRLSRLCSTILDEAEKRVTLLTTEGDGTATEQPFDPEAQ